MQRFEEIYAEHEQAVRAYVRRRAPERTVLDSTSVENNLFASTTDLPAGDVAAIRTLDANGNVTATEQLPSGAQQPANRKAGNGQPTNR